MRGADKWIYNFSRKWEDDVKIDLRETGCEGVDWIQLT